MMQYYTHLPSKGRLRLYKALGIEYVPVPAGSILFPVNDHYGYFI